MMARGIGEGDSGVQRLDSSVLMSLAQRKEWLLQCIRESLCPNRSHIVLLTTDLGCRLCTVTLGRNRQNFIMALFGVWRVLFTFPMNMSVSQ